MPVILTDAVKERGRGKLTVAFTDETPVAVTPTSAWWTLTDTLGNVVNGHTHEVLSGLSTSTTIILQGDDLALGIDAVSHNPLYGRERVFTVFYSYTSTDGNAVDVPADCQITISDLVAVS